MIDARLVPQASRKASPLTLFLSIISNCVPILELAADKGILSSRYGEISLAKPTLNSFHDQTALNEEIV